MCTTCGCSSDEVTVTDLGPVAHSHGHDHDHDHDQGHDQGHGHPHDHDHGQPHDHVRAGPTTQTLVLEEPILAKNDALADANRQFFAGRRILAVNLMSSPGSGKTTLLERTIRDLSSEMELCVVEGDQETLLDADRIKSAGARVIQINTGAGCHLDAGMVARGLRTLDPAEQSVVLIENVGNLVCPALFDLGERAKIVIMSVTEGHDKPLKYPQMFRAATLMVVNKVDLLPYVTFDVDQCVSYARQINPKLEVISVSATRGDGLDSWYGWLKSQR
ncbi:MAG TPA: hydrogenase nickel incorporation protein HypB [Actinomycetota bacterium]|nr:hydrogenase nickel incorporation protein HypB [Actinomycetota bacterium]